MTLSFSRSPPARRIVRSRTAAVLLEASPTYRFESHQEDGLVRRLQAQSDTRLVPVQRPEQLELDAQWRLPPHGCRLTTMAFCQICTLLASGLAGPLLSLLGERGRKRTRRREPVCEETAREVFLKVLHGRFSLLHRYSLVVDYRSRLVEGIVGSRYQFLPNRELLQRVQTQAAQRGFEFHSATLDGRRLSLRYRWPGPSLVVRKGCHFQGGLHLANGELGDCRIKGSAFLSCELGGLLQPYPETGGMIHRRGEQFEPRFRRVLQSALQSGEAALAEHGERLQELPRWTILRLPPRPQELQRLKRGLHRGGITAEVAAVLLDRMLRLATPAAGSVDGLLLCAAIGSVVGDHVLGAQELLEQSAYRLLVRPGLLYERNEGSNHVEC